MWYFNTSYGTVYIVPKGGGYTIRFEDIEYGHYHSANSAADDVSCFSTGSFEWDRLAGLVYVPDSVSEWEFE